jgi:hypothetical protein
MMRFYGLPFALPIVGAIGYGALPDRGEVYAVPLDKAYSQLSRMELEPGLRSIVAASDNLGLITATVPNQSVTWKFTHQGAPVGQVRADLAASGADKTRVKVTFELAERGELKHHAAFVNQQELVSSFITIHLQERIAAKLEGRKFDESKVGEAMAEYMLTHPQAMMKFGYDMTRAQHDPRLNGHDEAIKWREKLEEAEAKTEPLTPEERAEAAEEAMRAASRPAVDTSKY